MNSEKHVLEHDYGYGLNIAPNKIKKLYLRNIDDLRVYVKDVIYKNIVLNNNLKIEDITNQIVIEKTDYTINYMG